MAGSPSQLSRSAGRHAYRRWLAHVIAFALALALPAVSGEPVAHAADPTAFRIVVHRSNTLEAVSRNFVADAFLKKTTRWPGGGETIRPLDQRANSAIRRAFSENVLKRSVAAVRSYWQQRIFSGRDVPPPELDSDESVIAYVTRTPGALGYVSSHANLTDARELQIQ